MKRQGLRARLGIAVLTLVALVGSGSALLRLIDTGEEQTQIRNAFIARPGQADDFDWTPGAVPEGFLVEEAPIPDVFAEAAESVRSGERASAFETALALARHLASGPGVGDGIKSSTVQSYSAILTEKRGYCSDYTQVMNGLAYAAGIPIREWGMSFDDYSGSGHAFSEVYDDELRKWVFLDSFFSLYAVDRTSRTPLSVLELRSRLAGTGPSESVEILPIDEARFGFKSEQKALEYYRRGGDRFFLYFGNNVFSYDSHPVVAAASPVSRALEEATGIALGLRPEIRLLRTETNESNITRLFSRRRSFVIYSTATGVLAMALVAQILAFARLRQADNDHI